MCVHYYSSSNKIVRSVKWNLDLCLSVKGINRQKILGYVLGVVYGERQEKPSVIAQGQASGEEWKEVSLIAPNFLFQAEKKSAHVCEGGRRLLSNKSK